MMKLYLIRVIFKNLDRKYLINFLGIKHTLILYPMYRLLLYNIPYLLLYLSCKSIQIKTIGNISAILCLEQYKKDLIIIASNTSELYLYNITKLKLPLRSYLTTSNDSISILKYIQTTENPLFLSGGKGNIINLWSVEGHKSLKTYNHPNFSCLTILSNYKPNMFISAGGKELKLWNVTNNDYDYISNKYSISENYKILCIEKVNDKHSNTILTGGSPDMNSNSITLWNLDTKKVVKYYGFSIGEVHAIKYAKNNTFITACAGSIIHIWNLRTSLPIKQLSIHNDYILDLYILPGREILLSVGRDKQMIFTNIESFNVIKTYTNPVAMRSIQCFESRNKIITIEGEVNKNIYIFS